MTASSVRAIALCGWLCGGALLGACGGEQRGASEPACDCPACDCPEPATPPPAETPGATPPSEVVAEQPAPPRVRAGSCDTGWLPAGTARDLSDEDAEALADAVRDWLAGPGTHVVPAAEGIVYAKSEDDRGDDPPYPPEAAALSARACGLGARWLADHLRARFALAAGPDGDGVVCDENVCCSAGMEYVPHARIVFARHAQHDAWAIESALFVNEAALGDEHVARNRAFVAAALTRLARRRCGPEPWLAR